VTERAVYAALVLLLVGLMGIAMASMHREHYKGRKWQMLEARVNVIEKIIGGEHD
jgi:hypothetical protein